MRPQYHHATTRLAVLMLTLALAAIGPPLIAQEHDFEIAGFVTPGASYNDVLGLDLDLGYAFGFGWHFRQKWSLDARASFDDGSGVERRRLEVGARRRLGQWNKWASYGSLGVHFQDVEIERGFRGDPCGDPEVLCISDGPRREEIETDGIFLGFDVERRLSDRFGLRFDGRYLFDDDDDPLFLSVGLAFGF